MGARRTSGNNTLQVIGEAKAEGDERQRGICAARRRVHGRAGDVQIREAMHPTARVYDAVPWIRVHARGAHVMPAAAERFGPGRRLWLEHPLVHSDAADATTAELAPQSLVEATERPPIERR